MDHRQWEPAPEWLPRVLVDDAADCVPEAEQLLAANGLDDTTPAGHTAQGGPSSPEDEEPQVTGGLTPHPDSPLKDMASVVKDDDYRACWKFCLAEMRAELSGRKRRRDGYGPAQIRKRALIKYTRAPSVKTLQNAFKNSIESPPKIGRTCDMPEGVSVWLEEILKGFRKHKFMLPKTSVIENAKLLITGTVYEDLYALQRPPHSRQMSGLRLRATFSPLGLRPSRSTWRLRRTLGRSTTTHKTGPSGSTLRRTRASGRSRQRNSRHWQCRRRQQQ